MRTNAIMAGESLPVYASGGRQVGNLATDESGRIWLTKGPFNPVTHKYHARNGWATDVSHIDLCVQHAAVGIRVQSTDGRLWESSLTDWQLHGEPLHHPGHGPQKVLAGRYWRVTNSRGERQLSLFEAVA